MDNPREFITEKTDIAGQFKEGEPCYGEVNLGGKTLQWYGEHFPNDMNDVFRIVTKVYVENEEETANIENVYSNADEVSEETALKILKDNGGWNYLE